MHRLLLLFPALACVLFAAHLLFHGFGLVPSALPLAGILLLFFRRRPAVLLMQGLLVCFTVEWIRAGWVLAAARLEAGRSLHPAAEIMAGVALFTLLSALVFRHPRLRG